MLLRLAGLKANVAYLGLALFLSRLSHAESAQAETCSIEFPVYSPEGNRLAFEVQSVSALEEGNPPLNMLDQTNWPDGLKREKDRVMRKEGNRVFFSKRWIGGRPFKVVLKDATGRTAESTFSLNACRRRFSIQYGSASNGADVSWTLVEGRIKGCKLQGDWWVRAVPMFDNNFRQSFEGYIDKGSGSFQFHSSFFGVRHMFVIGSGKEPVKVFSFNVVQGKNNEVGEIDLQGLCVTQKTLQLP